MAVDNGVKKAFYDNSEDDDDGPIVFKRNNIASKKGQLSSTPTKPSSSQKHVEPSGRRISDQSAANRLNSVSQKSKVASTTKVSHVEPSGRRISDQSDANGLNSVSQKSKVALTPKVSAGKCNTVSSISQPKHFTEHRLATNGVERVLNKFSHEDEESDDSDDDIPLSVRLSADSAAVQSNNSSHAQKLVKHSSKHSLVSNGTGKMTLCKSDGQSGNSDDGKPLNPKFSTASVSVQKSNSLHATEVLRSPMPASSASPNMKANIKNYSDDSEDEKPLASRFSLKPGVGTLAKKLPDSDEEKPLASRHEQNGSSKRDSNSELKPSKGLSKRPLGDISSSTNSSIKKAKVSDVSVTVKVKHEPVVKEEDIDDDDHMPISLRMKKSVSSANQSSAKKVMKKINSSSFKKETKTKKAMKKSKFSKSMTVPPGSGGGQKWTTLQHNGVIFPPPYKPHGVKILYNGQPVDLTHEQEEVATMFAVMKDTDYATKEKFIDNFMNDWRQILGRNHVIKKFELCDFTPIYEWHLREKEKKKQMSTEEKKALKEEKLKQEEKYMWATVDGIKEKVGNFRVEPPGLFRGRGEHPKMGKLKRRIRPKDITINIGKDAPIPECPIPGERWKEVKHDNSVTWLAFWNDPINPKDFKYVFLAASSSLKGQSDKEKYEKARLLKDYIHGIRANYTKDFSSKDATKRQIAVATYLIDKLALRAGNEKDDDEADTVGCCTLKVENVALIPPNKLQFDFLGKDSIRYFNIVEVELPVYKAIGEFRNGGGKRKADGDDLFDMLDTSKLNAHLKELMPGLTAKVFRTYNASITLDDMLNIETKDGTLPEKVAVYQHANKEVAIICNHQRSVSKSHDAQMSRLNDKIDELKAQQEELKVDLSRSRKGKPPLKDAEGKSRNFSPEVLEKKLAQIDARMEKMELDKKIKEDLKTVALGTSKINYLDPRISVAWCKRHEVPIEKIFNKSLLAKFAWAMDVDPSFRF